jgi:hypothetical protein
LRPYFLLALVGLTAFCPSCGTAANVSARADAGAGDAATQPDPQCAAGAGVTFSLSGTAGISGFTTPVAMTSKMDPGGVLVSLYGLFPYGTQPSVSGTQKVPPGGTWTFRCLPAGAHYYVQAEAHFNVADARPASVAAIAGPLTVPSSGPVAVHVQPLQVEVLESRSAGSATRQLRWALVHLFDPATGDEVTGGATVAIDVGGSAPTPIPWRSDAPRSRAGAYYVQFVSPPQALPSYTVTASLGGMSLSSKVVADPPTFDGAITSPSDGAMVAAGAPLTVAWTAQSQADYEIVELFQNTMGQLIDVYASPQPDGPSLTQEPTPIPGATLTPGNYLLSVSYSKTNCPPDAAGCVHSDAVSAATLTAK